MIRGRFASSPPRPAVPYIDAYVRIASDAEYWRVGFVVDTGTDFTIIHPRDASRLWPDYETRTFGDASPVRVMHGVGGSARFLQLLVDLQFEDDELGPLSSSMTIHVARPDDPEQWDLPSLLGRDVLQAFTLTIDARSETITLAL